MLPGGWHGASAAPHIILGFRRSKFRGGLILAIGRRLLSKAGKASTVARADVAAAIFDDVGEMRWVYRGSVSGYYLLLLLLLLLSIDKLKPWDKKHSQGEEHPARWRD